jgi:Domain of unknown function (DUF4340)
MNLKTTLALVILAVLVAVLVWKGPDLAPKVGLAPEPAPAAKGTSADALAKINAPDISAVTVNVPGSAPIKFSAAEAGKPLELPGNWPIRRNEVEELVGTLCGLKSRFQPVAIEADLKEYGLSPSQEPVVVEVATTGGKHTLTFGEPKAKPGENPFTMPAYVRVDDQTEVLRLGPDVLPVLKRPADFYRKRQLFPDATRVKVAESSRMAQEAVPQFMLSDAVTGITVEGPQGKYVLRRIGESPKPKPPVDKPTGDAFVTAGRIADVWEIVEPVRDRADPVKLKNVLAAIPDLWVEQFLLNPDAIAALGAVFPVGVGDSPALSMARSAVGSLLLSTFQKDGPFLDRAGLKDSPSKIALTLKDGSTRTLLVGKTTRTSVRAEATPPPMFPGAPPQPPKIIEEKFYYAKLADNPIVFEIKGDKIADLFFETKKDPMAKMDLPETPVPAVEQLRDANVARFETDHVVGITISRPGQTLELRKTKGDPKAESEAARKDRWYLKQPFDGLAEAKQVSDLLDPLERLAAKKGEIVDRDGIKTVLGAFGAADLAAMGLAPEEVTTVTITSDTTTGIPPRTIRIGRHDAVTKKMFVQGPGDNRINVIEDIAFAVVERQPRAYRALKLFDLGDDRVDSIAVQGEKEKFRIQENVGTTSNTFVLTEPVKTETDQEKARNLLKDLGNLEATEYVYDPPGEKEAAALRILLSGFGVDVLKAAAGSHGLDKPTATVTLNFAGPKRLAPRTLTIGKAREGKPEFFAKLDDSSSVFGIKKEVAETLTGGSLGLLPLQLWNGSPDGVKAVEVTRGTESPFAMKQEGGTWKITAPFDAAADNGAAMPLAAALSAVKAERYAAHSATNPAEYGFDKPALKIKFTLTERKVNKPGDEPKEETKERVLVVGKQEAENKPGRFAKLEGDANAAVFVIPDASFKDLDKPALELLNKRLLAVVPSFATKLELNGPDGALTLQKEGVGDSWKPVGATFPVDKPTVDSLFRILANLNALKFADYGDKIDWAKYGLDPNSKPATVTVTAGTETHKLEVGKVVEGTPNDRYARVDGGKAVAVLPITVARDLSKGKLELVERTIFKFDPIDLQAVRRTMGGQEFETLLEGTNWNVTKPVKLPADQQGMEELADRLSSLRAERVADVEGKDLAKYGLDKPAAIVKLELIGKGAKPVDKSIKIGAPVDPMKPDGERFAQAEGATTVVVLGGPIGKKLLAEPNRFRERNLASFVTADKVVISRNGKDLTFVKSGGNWKMTEPVASESEDEALRELHDALARLRAEEIVAEKPADLKPYGLDKAERWRLFNGDKEVLNLLVGAREKIGEPGKQKDGFRAYAKLEKGDLVVLLDMSLTAKLAAEYRKRALWEPLDVAQATSIEVDTPEGPGSFKLLKGALGWVDPMNPTQRIETATVTEFLDAFAGLKAERFVEHNATDGGKLYGLDPARKIVTVSTQNGQQRKILLGRVDDSKRVYAKLEGKKEVVLLSEADTAKINRDKGGFGMAEKKEAEPKKEEPKKGLDVKKGEPMKGADPKKE